MAQQKHFELSHITHHLACDCREAVHKEVAEALRSAIDHMDWVMRNRLDYTHEEITANLEPFLDALERYNEMYGWDDL